MADLLSQELTIDENSKTSIQLLAKQTTLIAVAYIPASLIALCNDLWRYFKYRNETYHTWINIFNLQVSPYILFVSNIAGIFQIWFYYSAWQLQKKAVVESDQLVFNKSFELFRKGNIMAYIIAAIHILLQLVIFYFHTAA